MVRPQPHPKGLFELRQSDRVRPGASRQHVIDRRALQTSLTSQVDLRYAAQTLLEAPRDLHGIGDGGRRLRVEGPLGPLALLQPIPRAAIRLASSGHHSRVGGRSDAIRPTPASLQDDTHVARCSNMTDAGTLYTSPQLAHLLEAILKGRAPDGPPEVAFIQIDRPEDLRGATQPESPGAG